MPKTQHGTILKRSGSWVGRYSRWVLDQATGERTRLQKSLVVGAVDKITKVEASATVSQEYVRRRSRENYHSLSGADFYERY